jgi:O-antigen ligase
MIYAGLGYILLTRVRLPSPLHVVVYTMAAGVLIVTLLDVEFAVAGLAMMIPFARPGFTVPIFGGQLLHFSGLNVAVVGVWLVFIFRYMTDPDVAAKGPLWRRTPVDAPLLIFLLLAFISTMNGLNLNAESAEYQVRNILYMKEQVMYVLWFYLVVTLLRTPEDVRRFAVFFAVSGIFVSMIGLHARITGAIEQAGTYVSEEEMQGGVAGGRTGGVGQGGWFGLGHPNLYAAFLLMTLPLWFFGVEHLKRGFMKLMVNLGVVLGFVALLYTYARSGWLGMTAGMGLLGLRDHRILKRLILFVVLFAVVAQVMTLSMVGMGVLDVVELRFSQLETSEFSSRPAIWGGALHLMTEYPLLGVGIGAFRNHAVTTRLAFRVIHAHNVILTYACELGLPCTAMYIIFLGMVLGMAWRNLRARAIPSYGFIAQGGFVGMSGVLLLAQFDHIFFDRSVGFAFYGLMGLIVAFNRMLREERLPGQRAEGKGVAIESTRPPSRIWIES